MIHRTTVNLCAAFLLGLATAGCAVTDPEAQLERKAVRIHERVLALDTHVDIPPTYMTGENDPGVRGKMQVDLPKMEEGGLDAAFFIVFVPQTERTPENYAAAYELGLTKFEAIRLMALEKYADRIQLALTADDVRRIYADGKKVALIGIENGYVMGKDLGRLQQFYDLGARYFSLTHNGHTDLADSQAPRQDLGDERAEHNGISPLGEQAVAELNRLGIMVDVSHAGPASVFEAAKISKAPIIASHHALSNFVSISRNLTDAELKAIAETNGVVQIVAFDSYVKAVPEEKIAARRKISEKYGIDSFAAFQALDDETRAAYEKERDALNETWPRASVNELVDHIDYAVNLIGIDHVGISSDFGGGGGIEGWDNASETLNVTRELVRRGYTEREIEKIWSENLLRVMEDVEKVAQEIQAAG